MPDAAAGRSRGRRGFLAAAVVLGASVVALFVVVSAGQAQATGAVVESPRGPYAERTVLLSVPGELRVGREILVAVDVVAESGDVLSVFIDPRGRRCPSSALAQPDRAIPLVSEVVVDGAFRVEAAYRPRRAGERRFCAYLSGPSRPTLGASEARTVKTRLLRAPTARRTVAKALRRHEFASRVVKSVDQDCDRRRRNLFACRFEASFPGYRLRGKGHVRLGVRLSYRFRVRAQGVRSILTDENEERPSG